jgi:chemotaxis protein CheZ
MSDAADDFDALFEEVSAQRNEAVAAAATPDAPAAGQPAAQEGEGDEEGKGMYERLGGIVRLLHDSLRELGYDKALADASIDIADAQDRLEYIATLTEQSANKVLNTLDEGMPAQDALGKTAKDMDTRWGLLFEGKMSLDEFKALAGDSRQFALAVSEATEKEKARLLDIMMAQDFQDITGQIIKKVVTVTKKVETDLAQLLMDNAPAEVRERQAAKPVALMDGPSVPTAAMAQDDVDDLLADLGF